MERTSRFFDALNKVFEKGDGEDSNNAAFLFSTLQEPTLKDVAAFHDWIEECNRRIDAKRKALDHAK